MYKRGQKMYFNLFIKKIRSLIVYNYIALEIAICTCALFSIIYVVNIFYKIQGSIAYISYIFLCHVFFIILSKIYISIKNKILLTSNSIFDSKNYKSTGSCYGKELLIYLFFPSMAALIGAISFMVIIGTSYNIFDIPNRIIIFPGKINFALAIMIFILIFCSQIYFIKNRINSYKIILKHVLQEKNQYIYRYKFIKGIEHSLFLYDQKEIIGCTMKDIFINFKTDKINFKEKEYSLISIIEYLDNNQKDLYSLNHDDFIILDMINV